MLQACNEILHQYGRTTRHNYRRHWQLLALDLIGLPLVLTGGMLRYPNNKKSSSDRECPHRLLILTHDIRQSQISINSQANFLRARSKVEALD
jgi:hypothetical protein